MYRYQLPSRHLGMPYGEHALKCQPHSIDLVFVPFAVLLDRTIPVPTIHLTHKRQYENQIE